MRRITPLHAAWYTYVKSKLNEILPLASFSYYPHRKCGKCIWGTSIISVSVFVYGADTSVKKRNIIKI